VDPAPDRAAVGAEKALLQPELVHLAGQESPGMGRQRFQVAWIGHASKCAGQQLLFSVTEQTAEPRVDLEESPFGTNERESDGSGIEGVPAARALDAGHLPGGLAVAP
jgi:hypothetical protein